MIADTLVGSLRVQHRENWYNIFYLGYKYDDSKSTQLSCSDELLKGSIHKTKDMEISRTRGLSFRNRKMLKAANFLRDNMENNKDRFYYILSLYLLNGLHNIDELQDKINYLLIENNVTKDDIVFSNVKIEMEHSRKIYDVEFFLANGTEYDYELNVEDGTVISFDYDAESSFQHLPPASGGIISENQAMQTILSRVPGAKE